MNLLPAGFSSISAISCAISTFASCWLGMSVEPGIPMMAMLGKEEHVELTLESPRLATLKSFRAGEKTAAEIAADADREGLLQA